MTSFGGIMADPPWPYDNPRALVGNGGKGSSYLVRKDGQPLTQVDVGQHYEVMTIEQIMALPVAAAAARDCLLFMWTTNPFLADGTAAAVVKAWGFKPKTVITWAKVQANCREPSMKTGHWFRSASEHMIFAVRGHPRRPEDFIALPTWKPAFRLPHSVKPDLFYRYVELACPKGPWLELFARRPREGWFQWGNEIESTFEFGG